MQLKRVTAFSPFPFPSQVPSSSFPYVTLELYELCREKEEQLCRVTEVQRLQAQQADAALEEFKRQVEVNSEKVYAEMKEQVRHTLILRNISLLTTWWGLETASEVKTHLPLQRTLALFSPPTPAGSQQPVIAASRNLTAFIRTELTCIYPHTGSREYV